MLRFYFQRGILLLSLIFGGLVLSSCSILDSKAKAGLQVETGNIPSSLFLDGQYLEKSPYIGKDLKPGTYTLKIQPDDATLVPSDVNVTLRQGLLTVVTWLPAKRTELSGGVVYELEKLDDRNATELAIVSIPDGAIIELPGEPKSFAPIHFTDLSPGEKEYEVSLPSYDSQKHTVNLIKGLRTTITIKLAKSSDSTAESIDQAVLGTATASAGLSTGVNATNSGTLTASSSAQTALQTTATQVKILPTSYSENGIEGLRVRSEASSDSPAIGFIATGSHLPYLQQNLDGWYKITLDAKTGWVSSHYAQLEP